MLSREIRLAALLAVLLVGCLGCTAQSPVNSVPEPESAAESTGEASIAGVPAVEEESAITEPEPQLQAASDEEDPAPPANEPFRDPSIAHALADRLLAVVEGFGGECLFPEFENLAGLPYSDYTVLNNVYWVARERREELLPDVPPLTAEEEAHVYRYADSVEAFHRGDLDRVGRLFFGDGFQIPPDTDGHQVGLIPETDFYSFLYGRGGIPHFLYLVTAVEEDAGLVTATFLPYQLDVSWDDNTIMDVAFINNTIEPFGSSSANLGELRYPSDAVRMEADARSCLEYYYLRGPQERLGTITVTFQQEPDGRFIALSCLYNRGQAEPDPLQEAKPE